MTKIIINFSHPLTPAQIEQAGLGDAQIIDVVVSLAPEDFNDLPSTADALIERVGLTATEWQASQIIVRSAALSDVSALILAGLHGRMGHYPALLPIVRDGAVFVAQAPISLDDVRGQARTKRY